MLAVGMRTIQRFLNGNAVTPPMRRGETFPFGDPTNIQCINIEQPGATESVDRMIAQVMAQVDRAVINRGIVILGGHQYSDRAMAIVHALIARKRSANDFDFSTIRDALLPWELHYGTIKYPILK
jgi:hypothetical protein